MIFKNIIDSLFPKVPPSAAEVREDIMKNTCPWCGKTTKVADVDKLREDFLREDF